MSNDVPPALDSWQAAIPHPVNDSPSMDEDSSQCPPDDVIPLPPPAAFAISTATMADKTMNNGWPLYANEAVKEAAMPPPLDHTLPPPPLPPPPPPQGTVSVTDPVTAHAQADAVMELPASSQAPFQPQPSFTSHLSIDDYGFYYDADSEAGDSHFSSFSSSSAAAAVASAASGSGQSKDGSRRSSTRDPSRFHLIRDMKEYRRREIQWLTVFQQWQQKHARPDRGAYKELRSICRRGIPDSVRARAWQFLARSDQIRQEGVYAAMLTRPPMTAIYEIIERDINRCYPDHFFFRDKESLGQIELFNVLKAYAQYNPEVGYCQGMGRLVGMMLMQMPAEDSFWLLASTITHYLYGYYSPDLHRLRMHAMIFERLLQRHLPAVARHLRKNDIEPLIYMTNWFMTVFTMTLPWPSVLRAWDMFYCDGVKALFRIALGIMSRVSNHLLKKCPTSTELIDYLLHIPHSELMPDRLIREVLRVRLSTRDVLVLERQAEQAWEKQGAPSRGTLAWSTKR